MRRLVLRCCAVLLVSMFAITSCWAQTAAAGATATVPPLVKVSGTLANAQGTVGVTFALYAEQTGGAPLWLETQNVTPDANGRYTVYLGANHANGVPLNLFASGEARWLGVQPEGQPEQARAQLVSVPYALTAGDAQTLGGQPLSAFVLTSAVNGGTTTSGGTTASAGSSSIVALATPQAGGTPVTTNSGTTGYLAKFTSTAGDIENSLVYDTGTAVGIGTTAPASALHVSTTVPPAAYFDVYSGSPTTVLNIMPTVNRAARGTPTNPSAVQLNDYIAGMAARGYGSTKFANGGRAALRMQASENWTDTNQGTYMSFWTSATGSTVSVEHMRLDPLGNVGIGTQTPSATLEVNGTAQFDGQVTFAGGVNAATSFNLGGQPFAFGSYANSNAFLGFAGNSTTTAFGNTASGYAALQKNTTGSSNTAIGIWALYSNTTGNVNTALGYSAGNAADASSMTGSNNTAIGDGAAFGTGTLTNATAIGANAEVAISNALVLGSISGVNNATASTNVGIGTTSPAYTLDVHGTGNFTGLVTFAAGQTISGGTTGVNATGSTYGVSGSSGNSGIAGVFNNTGGGKILSGQNNGNEVISVAANGSITTQGGLNLDYANSNNGTLSTGSGIVFGGSGSGEGIASQRTSGTGQYGIDFYTSGQIRMTLANNTYLGIGTRTPGNILTVAQGHGSAIADGWTTYSSRRFKTNIMPLIGALDKVRKLQGVSYDLKNGGEHQIGLVAEDAGKVVPEVVSWENNGVDAKAIDYSRLTALLIEATKEQQAEIERLARANAEKQEQIESLMQQVRQLQQSQQALALVESRLVELEKTSGSTSARSLAGHRLAALNEK